MNKLSNNTIITGVLGIVSLLLANTIAGVVDGKSRTYTTN